MKQLLLTLAATIWMGLTIPAIALTLTPATPDERVQAAAVICHATVLGVESFRGAEGGIHTRTWLQVNEALKGNFPATIAVVHRGGRLGEEGEVSSDAPNLQPGEERLFLLGRLADGTLFVDNGDSGAPLLARAGTVRSAAFITADPDTLALLSAARARYPTGAGPDLTKEAANAPNLLIASAVPGLATNAAGISRRFTAGDRREPVEYLIDADTLPAGITMAQALGAVSNAFRAWENVTTLRFRFGGLESFGAASPNVAITDGRIRLQLHDRYNFNSGSSTLGTGGNAYSISSAFPNGGMGGRVNGNEFFPVTRGFLVLKHTRAALANLVTFEEVLCHELGHVLSLAHSSENSFEPDPVRSQSIMYFRAHADGRGASLRSYDPPVVQQAYPMHNTPPYGYNRMLHVVTASPAPNIPGVNEMEIRGYDTQIDSLTASLASATATSGTFDLSGNVLRYVPNAAFGDSARLDPAGASAYDRAFLRFSDGTHGSPYVEVRVLSFNIDRYLDGMPDNWMVQHFGSANPGAGALRGPDDDFDGDGVSNRNEYRLGTDPRSVESVLRFSESMPSSLKWLATPYEVYEVEATTDFTTWFRAGNPVVPTTTSGVFTSLPDSPAHCQFFRVLRVP